MGSAAFKIVFYILVEIPSMIVIALHKYLFNATEALPIWVYRTIGFLGLCAVFMVLITVLRLAGAIEGCDYASCE
jgi:hypothetical protein